MDKFSEIIDTNCGNANFLFGLRSLVFGTLGFDVLQNRSQNENKKSKVSKFKAQSSKLKDYRPKTKVSVLVALLNNHEVIL